MAKRERIMKTNILVCLDTMETQGIGTASTDDINFFVFAHLNIISDDKLIDKFNIDLDLEND